jgi:hypothetical protein
MRAQTEQWPKWLRHIALHLSAGTGYTRPGEWVLFRQAHCRERANVQWIRVLFDARLEALFGKHATNTYRLSIHYARLYGHKVVAMLFDCHEHGQRRQVSARTFRR